MIRRTVTALLVAGAMLLSPAASAAFTWDDGTQVYPPESFPCGGYYLNDFTATYAGELRGLLDSTSSTCPEQHFIVGNSEKGFTVERAGVRMRGLRAIAADEHATYFLWDRYRRYPGREVHLARRFANGQWTDRVLIKNNPNVTDYTMAASGGHWWIAAIERRTDTRDSRFSAVVWESGKGKVRLTPKSWDNYVTYAHVAVSATAGPMVATSEVSSRSSSKRVAGPVVYRLNENGWSRPKFVMTPSPQGEPLKTPHSFTIDGMRPVMTVRNERDRWWVVTGNPSGWESVRYRFDKSRYYVTSYAEQGNVWLTRGPWRGTEPVAVVARTGSGWEHSPLPREVYPRAFLSLGDGRLNAFASRRDSDASSMGVWTGTP